jgi:hypothetical protein
MESVAEILDTKLREWHPDTADAVRRRVAELIELADNDPLDILPSQEVEQELLDLLDAPPTR